MPDDALAFGYTRSAFWVRWRLENASAQARRTVVDLGNPREDFVHWHVVRRDGRVEDSLIGDRVPFAQRTVPTRTLAHLIELAPHERVDLYVRLASHDGLFEPMPVRFAERLAFIDVVERENLALMLFHGGIIALGLYNLLKWPSARKRSKRPTTPARAVDHR